MDQKKFRWWGIVVEPNPTTFKLLAQNYANAIRSGLRRQCSSLWGGRPGDALRGRGASYGRDGVDPPAGDGPLRLVRSRRHPSAFKRVAVTCLSLESLWRRHVAPWLSDRVDILRLDTAEKLEHAIVLATNFSRLIPRAGPYPLRVRPPVGRGVPPSAYPFGAPRLFQPRKWPGCGESGAQCVASHTTRGKRSTMNTAICPSPKRDAPRALD